MNPEVPFRQIVECLPDGVVQLDPSGLIQYMNPTAERLTDTALQDAVGRHWRDVFSVRVEDPAQDQTGSLMEILLERPVLITKSGATIPIELQITPLPDDSGGIFGSILILHDVTDLNVEKEGLKESRAKYKRLVNTIEGIVWEADGPNMKIRFVSDFAEKLLGYSLRNWVKDPSFWQSIIHPDDRKSVMEIVQHAIEEEEGYQIEYRILTADGRALLVRDSVSLSKHGSVVRLSGVMTDITSSQQARDALIKSEELFAAAFHANPAALLLITEAGKVVDANESFERMSGFFRPEILDRTYLQTGLCSAEQFEAVTKQVGNHGELNNIKFRLRDLMVLASFRKILLTGEPCLLGHFQDVQKET